MAVAKLFLQQPSFCAYVKAIVRVGHLSQAGFGLRSWPSMPRLYSTSTVYPSAWYAGSCFSRYMANLAQMQRSLRLASRRYRSWRLKSARAAWTRAWWVVGDGVGMGGTSFFDFSPGMEIKR